MRRVLFLLLCVCFVYSKPVFAQAQMGVDLPNGFSFEHISLDEARELALEVEPGRIIKSRKYKNPVSMVYYEFLIRRDDGTIMSVIVDGVKGRVSEHKVERLPNARARDVNISQREATEIATKYIKNDQVEKGIVSYFGKTILTLVGGKPCYRINAQMNKKKYSLYVDAKTGDVTHVK